MAFSKKTWDNSDIIPAADLNRIETGIDDIYNLNVTLEGIKTVDGDMELMNSNISNKTLYITKSGVKKGEILVDNNSDFLFKEYDGNGFQFINEQGSLQNVICGIVNDIIVEDHKGNHRDTSLDYLPIAADLVVDINGNGDYDNLPDAITNIGSGRCIYVKDGVYSSTSLSVPDNIHITGGINSVLTGGAISLNNKNTLTGLTLNARVVLNGNNCIVKNNVFNGDVIGIEVKNTSHNCIISNNIIRTSSATTAIAVSSDCTILNNIIYHDDSINNGNGIYFNVGTIGCICKDNYIYGIGKMIVGIRVVGEKNIIEGNKIYTATTGIYVSASKSLIHGNMIKAVTPIDIVSQPGCFIGGNLEYAA